MAESSLDAMRELFEKHSDEEFLKFDRIPFPRHPRRDVCAFLLLHEMVPTAEPMISAAEHDEYFLSVDCEKLADVASEDAIKDLLRCGIRYDNSFNCLAVFS